MAKKKTKRAAARRKPVKAASRRRSKPTRKPARAAPGRRKPARPGLEEPEALFAQACDLASRGFLFDAISLFRQVTLSRAHELADDAWTDIGLCCLKMNLFPDALEAFGRVIDEYPDAMIARVVGAGKEVGRTAAKARLGRVHALLGIGDRASAAREARELEKYHDSYAVDGAGVKRSFHELALAAIG